MEENEILSVSDEDFLKLPVPDSTEEVPSEPPAVEAEPPAEVVEPEPVVVETEEEEEEPPVETGEEGKTEVEPKPAEVPAEPAVADVDYKGNYEKLMAPIKANGKSIELRSPEELIQLAQMGANYTAKMQQIAPHRKVLMMLEQNGLLDEGKLSYLIDLDKKNPGAIQQLVKDSGLDPMDIDTNADSTYKATSHAVSDAEVSFNTALEDMRSTEDGKATLQVINSQWDAASKEALWTNPEIMETMRIQREAGIYDRIEAEVTRQRTLGRISQNVPFLQAYKAVGDQLVAAHAFDDLIEASKPPVQQTPVATRVVAPKPAVTNNEQAKAASTTRATPRPAKVTINPLAMSDDDFLKQMSNRL